jgi:hypothetical protein
VSRAVRVSNRAACTFVAMPDQTVPARSLTVAALLGYSDPLPHSNGKARRTPPQ